MRVAGVGVFGGGGGILKVGGEGEEVYDNDCRIILC